MKSVVTFGCLSRGTSASFERNRMNEDLESGWFDSTTAPFLHTFFEHKKSMRNEKLPPLIFTFWLDPKRCRYAHHSRVSILLEKQRMLGQIKSNGSFHITMWERILFTRFMALRIILLTQANEIRCDFRLFEPRNEREFRKEQDEWRLGVRLIR